MKRPPLWFNVVSSLGSLKAGEQECSFYVPEQNVDLAVGLSSLGNCADVSNVVEEEVKL